MAKKARDPEQALKESSNTAESKFLKFTWVIAVILAIILGTVALLYKTCGKTQMPFQEPTAKRIS